MFIYHQGKISFSGQLPEVISQEEVLRLWRVKKNKAKNFFSNEDVEGAENSFIIYLTGENIIHIIEKTGGLIDYPFGEAKKNIGIRRNRFWFDPKNEIEEIINTPSQAGYYLIKIIEETEDVRKDLDMVGWRIAKTNEAVEILISIYYVMREKGRFLENSFHVVRDKGAILAVGNFKKEIGLEIWLGPQKKFSGKRETILIKKQSFE